MANKTYEELRRELKRAVNELCQWCGAYTHEHNGACNGCRWKEVRHDNSGD